MFIRKSLIKHGIQTDCTCNRPISILFNSGVNNIYLGRRLLRQYTHIDSTRSHHFGRKTPQIIYTKNEYDTTQKMDISKLVYLQLNTERAFISTRAGGVIQPDVFNLLHLRPNTHQTHTGVTLCTNTVNLMCVKPAAPPPHRAAQILPFPARGRPVGMCNRL